MVFLIKKHFLWTSGKSNLQSKDPGGLDCSSRVLFPPDFDLENGGAFPMSRRLDGFFRYFSKTLTSRLLLILGCLVFFLFLYWTSLGPTVDHVGTSRLFAADFYSYWTAAGRLAHGISPYTTQMLEQLTSNQGVEIYRYPPALAFFCLPLSVLSYQIAGWIWVGVNITAFTVGTVLVLRIKKGYLSSAHLVCALAAAIWFLPSWHSLWMGNVEGLQVLLIGMTLTTGGKARTFGVTAHAWLKVAPVFLVPALLVREKKMAFWSLLLFSLLLVLPSFILSQVSYWQLPQMLINITRVSTVVDSNLAPAAQLVYLTHWTLLGQLVTGLVLLISLGLIILSIRLARRPEGWGAAVACGLAASLLFPATIWYHYLVILLPLLYLAWEQMSRRIKIFAVISYLVISTTAPFSLLITFGAAVCLMTLIIYTLWPKTGPKIAPELLLNKLK
jgi:hypothetical protein